MTPIECATRVQTDLVPSVTRWCDEPDDPHEPVYILEFEDADVSVRLTEAQVRGLGSRILAATMDDYDD